MNWITLNNLSIKQRITISYILFILIPFCLLSIHSYVQTKNFQKEQLAGNLKQTLTVVKNSIDGKLNLVESISHNITYNTTLQSFLYSPFHVESGSMDMYIQNIRPIVYYGLVYNQVEISEIKVYMNNYSIPEGFNSFQHDTLVKEEAWYKEFIESEQRSRWITLPTNDAYAYLQKIISIEGNLLGVSRVTILKQNLLASLNESSAKVAEVYVKDRNGQLLFSTNHAYISTAAGAVLNNVAEPFVQDGRLYVQDQNDRLGLYIGISESVPLTLHSQLLSTFGFIGAIVLSILLFYQVLKLTFVKIKASIRAMDHSIRTGFKEHIPVERNDEIGVISEKFNTLLVQINSLVSDMVKRETIHKDAQLKTLQAQINPHFIYNTINIFSAKTELAGLYDVSEAFSDFGQMLRYNMNIQSEYATIEKEINHVLSYIRLQKLKYGDRLQFNWKCDETLLSCPILRFIVQPIVENSISHGMKQRDHLLINLTIRLTDHNELELDILDNGTGIPSSTLAQLNQFFQSCNDNHSPVFSHSTGSGVGLGNINERIRLYYGAAYAIKMFSVEGEYTRTLLTLPFREELGGEAND